MKKLIFLFSWLFCSVALAQEFDFTRVINPFPVYDLDGTQFEFPFYGGFNAPLPQFVDIDADGDLDLFMTGMRDGSAGLSFFENVGTQQQDRWAWRTDRYPGTGVSGSRFVFGDADTDGDLDLVRYSHYDYAAYYRNDGSPTDPQFANLPGGLRYTGGLDSLIGFSAMAFVDLDCDRHQDLVGASQSVTLGYYRNMGPDSLGMPRYYYQGALGNFTINDLVYCEHHGIITANASVSAADIDADGDQDLFLSQSCTGRTHFLENVGTCAAPRFTLVGNAYPPDGSLNVAFAPVRFADLDADGDLDLYAGVLSSPSGPIGPYDHNFYYYENIGSPQQPVFELQTQEFINGLDLGSIMDPAFVDIDADDDLDIFLGGFNLEFIENQGTTDSPVLQTTDLDSLDWGLTRGGSGGSPTFGDLDDDGDLDLLVGGFLDGLKFYENTGSAVAPYFILREETYQGINPGNACDPVLGDLDADGDLDMLVGYHTGQLAFYRNTGSPTEAVFQLETAAYLNLYFYGTPTGNLIDVDLDDDLDMIIGDAERCYLFRNIGTSIEAYFVRDGSLLVSSYTWSSPALGDLDGDRDLDLLIGVWGGGLIYYQNQVVPNAIEDTSTPDAAVFKLWQNHPNPFRGETALRYDLPSGVNEATLSIYNAAGQRVREWFLSASHQPVSGSIYWDGAAETGRLAPSGLYFYRLSADGKARATQKMLLIR